jgi:ABC-type dipeptide/oligopeptide/nickel transport system permease subunit
MTVKLFLTIAAAISVLFGIAFVLAPETAGAVYGTPNEVHIILSERYFGATLLPLGLIFWFAKDTSDRNILRRVLIAFAIGCILGAIVSIVGTVAGTVNAMGWSSVLIYLVFLGGCAYYLKDDRAL